MEDSPVERYLKTLLGQMVTVRFPSTTVNDEPITGRLQRHYNRFRLVDDNGQELAYFVPEEVDRFQGRKVIYVSPQAEPEYLQEYEEPPDWWEHEPGDYDPADPDAYFPGSGEE